jgi:Ca-activated chloride channel family protein
MRIPNALTHPVISAALLLMAFTPATGQVTVPDRPAQPLFRGHQDEQGSSEIAFDPATRTATLKVDVQDLNGFFIPNLRRSHFAVFEDGIRQHNVSVEIEHAPVTLAVLMEMGGRSHQLNKTLAYDGVSMARQVLDVLGRDDKLAVFTYDDRLHTILDFAAPHDKWDTAFSSIPAPTFSEANFYDATIQVLDRLATMSGRKALLIVSTGIDTFSRATFDDLVKKAKSARTPVYVVGFGDLAHQGAIDTTRGPLARVDWKQCARQLESLARISGGRAYDHASAGTYDDIMENLRVRYVITYVSSQPATSADVRSVQVKLVDPKTDAPLRITDASGHRVEARAIAQATYTPSTASTRTSG